MDSAKVIADFKLLDREWVEKALAGTPYFGYVYMDCETKVLKRNYGQGHSIVLNFFSKDYNRFYYDRASMIRLRNSFLERVDSDPQYLEEFQNRWLSLIKEFDNVIEEVERTDLPKLDNQELFNLYNKFYDAYVNEYSLAIGIQDSFSMDAQNFILPLLKEILPSDKFHEHYEILFSPANESFINLEKRELLYMAKKAKEAGLRTAEEIINRFNQELEMHSKKYFWIENNYAHTKVLSPEYFAEKIMQELNDGINLENEIRNAEEHVPNLKRRKVGLLKVLNLDQKIINLIRIAECFTFMQDERKKYVLIGCHYLQRFLEEFCKRTNLSQNEFRQIIHPEIKDILLGKKFDRKKLHERYANCLCINTPDSYQIFEGGYVQGIYDKIFKPHIYIDEFKGNCASRGKARGPVRIVLTKQDLNSMQKGEILVASMTRPEMMVAVKKAIAIITDEGGITSHAAIISREMKIPCVIATNVATKVLRNGDVIEVDADNGIVKIVEKNR
ncbi:hypothetical protein HZC08_01840 [Candidatus Micrarchaeota archaeon]|nr:hypothetical protein [Candidatus Micrarchaeota archaeon]